jgi:transketolase
MPAILAAVEKAKAAKGKPQFIIARTVIGKASPKLLALQKLTARAEPSSSMPTRKGLGLPRALLRLARDAHLFC